MTSHGSPIHPSGSPTLPRRSAMTLPPNTSGLVGVVRLGGYKSVENLPSQDRLSAGPGYPYARDIAGLDTDEHHVDGRDPSRLSRVSVGPLDQSSLPAP